LRRLLDHIRIRDASGDYTREFCAGCENRRTDPCPYDAILTLVEMAEQRRVPGRVKQFVGHGVEIFPDLNGS